MRAYSYTAYTAKGQRKSGTLVAESERDASAQLEAKGLFASDISAQAGGGTRDKAAGRRVRLDPDTRAVFTRQMAVLLGSELSAEAALDVVLQSEGSARLQSYATRVKAEVMDGYPLSQAMERCGGGFERYYTSALRAGETSGDLGVVFEQLAEYLETRGQNRAQIASALIYPGFVAAVSLVVCAILLTSVAPQIVEMFEVSGQPLPDLTRTVLAISDWIFLHWVWLSAGLAGGALAMVLALRQPAFRDRWDRAMLRLPLVGRFMRLAAAAQYLRTLALVLSSRQTVMDGVKSAADVLAVARFRREAMAVEEAVRTGESLSRALTRLTPLPPVARQLVQAGEESARLPRMTDRAALLVETWLNDERKRVATILDPLLMMLVGVLVLVIVLAILLPIFDLQSVVA